MQLIYNKRDNGVESERNNYYRILQKGKIKAVYIDIKEI